ncbi:hypothetical protein WJX81_004931 [Elliptochloris bilobata]|uniref:Formin-like protein n=1 Tax=Elliptochloris bilobata TaxID=381761 RepID=A0AAW1RCG0_9CHLO
MADTVRKVHGASYGEENYDSNLQGRPRWDISIKEATPDAVSRAAVLAAGGQKAKYGALHAGWMPATPDEQVAELGALAPLLALAAKGPGEAARAAEETRLQRELALQDARLQRMEARREMRRPRAALSALPPHPDPAEGSSDSWAPTAGAAPAPAAPPGGQPGIDPMGLGTEGSAGRRSGSGPGSAVRALVTWTGNGCGAALGLAAAGGAEQPGCWTTRSFRARMESSCTLELRRRVQVTFADEACTPALVRFSHAAAPVNALEALGEIRLQARAGTQLQHVFRLGEHTRVLRCLRITFVAHLRSPGPGAHHVTRLRVTAPAATESKAAVGGSDEAQAPAGPVPSKPMVKLFWDKVPASRLADTVWRKVAPLDVDMDFAALEAGFAAREAPKRANNVGIVATRLKLSPAEVRAALLGMGEEGARQLDDEQLAGLAGCLPGEDEAAALAPHAASPAGLGVAEQIMLALMAVPRAAERLAAARLQRQFPSRLDGLRTCAAVLQAACSEVRACGVLPLVLRVALAAGNFLNAGSRAGAAAGFQVGALLKLREVRATGARGQTLLHYVAREVARHRAGAAPDLTAALPSAPAAARTGFAALQAEAAELRCMLEALEGLAAEAPAGSAGSVGGGSDCFGVAMARFRRDGLEQLGGAEGALAAALGDAAALTAYADKV